MNDRATLPLAPHEVHLWFAFFDRFTDPHLLARCAETLSPGERARQQRFLFEKDRHQFLVSHALVRTVLARYAGVAPAALTFATGRHGKPLLTGGPTLAFNLSHTGGLAALAVARGMELGVDVENLERPSVSVELAERFFAPAEVADLRRVPPADLRPAFFAYWTLKEAYIKARGLGLALPLADFAFDLAAHRPPRISFSERLADEPTSWQFLQFRPSPHHQAALAVRRPAGTNVTVLARTAGPEVALHAM